ncbi:hypothetical protein ACA910_017767 [Epithemia clementina (nom. ined.)]
MMSRKQVNRKREKSAMGPSAKEGTKLTSGASTEVGKKENLSAEEIEELDCIDLLDDEIDDAGVMHAGMEIPGLPEADTQQDKKAKAGAKKGKKAKAQKKTAAKKTGTKEATKSSAKKTTAKDDKMDQGKKEKLLKLAIQDAKDEFEDEKATILATVPSTIQAMFRQIGFAKWNKNFLPALILSPYDVPPGPARSIWMDMYRKMQENSRPLDKMSYLVFWYGEEKPSDYYSLIPNSNFTPYEKATTKMLQYARKAELRAEQKKPLSHDDKQRLRGMQQLKEDLEKKPEDRRRGDVVFQEGYELLTMDDVNDLKRNDEELSLSDDDDDEEEDDEEEEKPVSEKEEFSALEDSESDSASGGENDDELSPGKKKPASKSKVRRGSASGKNSTPAKNQSGKGSTAANKPDSATSKNSISRKESKGSSKKRNRASMESKKNSADLADSKEESPVEEEIAGGEGAKRKGGGKINEKIGAADVDEALEASDGEKISEPVPKKTRRRSSEAKEAPSGSEVVTNGDRGKEEGELSDQLNGEIDSGTQSKAKRKRSRVGTNDTDPLGTKDQGKTKKLKSRVDENDASGSTSDVAGKARRKTKKSKHLGEDDAGKNDDFGNVSDIESVSSTVKPRAKQKKSKTRDEGMDKNDASVMVDEGDALMSKTQGKGKKSKPKGTAVADASVGISKIKGDASEEKTRGKSKSKRDAKDIDENDASGNLSETVGAEADHDAPEENEVEDDAQSPIKKKNKKKGKKNKKQRQEDEDFEVSGEEPDALIVIKKGKKFKKRQSLGETDEDAANEADEATSANSKRDDKTSGKISGSKSSEEHQVEAKLNGDSGKAVVAIAERVFSKNEEKFEPLLRKWRSAIAANLVDEINQSLSEVLKELSPLCARFIEVYNIPVYMKESKSVLKQQNARLDRYQEVRKSIRDHYEKVKKNLPPFDPTVRFPDLQSPATNESNEKDQTESQDSTVLAVTSNGNQDTGSSHIPNGTSSEVKREAANSSRRPSSSSETKQPAADASVRAEEKNVNWMKRHATVQTSDKQRLLGLELLRQMASHFPDDKVNVDSVAILVEDALYEWANSTVGSKYWERLHAVVAGICGDSEPGSLMHEILDGKIKDPKELVSLLDKRLFAAFRLGEDGKENNGEAS